MDREHESRVGSTRECGCPTCAARTACTVVRDAVRWTNQLVECTVCGTRFRRCEQVHPERRLGPAEKARRKREADRRRYEREKADPVKHRERNRMRYEWRKRKMESDPEYKARRRAYEREWKRAHPERVATMTPDRREHLREYARRYSAMRRAADPDFAEAERRRHREWCGRNREKVREANAENWRRIVSNPKAHEAHKAKRRRYYRRRKEEGRAGAEDGAGL